MAAAVEIQEVDEAQVREALRRNFAHYSERALKIRIKEGAVQPFVLNRAQRHLTNAANKQLREKGRVRIITCKGRQQGVSTKVQGRFVWRITHRHGVKAFILTHRDDATANLFTITKRFIDHMPPPILPRVGVESTTALTFPNLDSSYAVGTAGSADIGRSDTIQMFHGSEVAFWPNAESIASGALQTVPDQGETEVWLESTANGMSNWYYHQWKAARAGESLYEAIFIPWFWQDEYRSLAPPNFLPTEEELEMIELYGVDNEQLQWRREKLIVLKDPALLTREYPNNEIEAFQSSGEGMYITAEAVLRARAREMDDDDEQPKILGVDPAGEGKATTSLIRRQGRVAYGLEKHENMKPMQMAGHIAAAIDRELIDKCFIDKGGLGYGIYDRLRELGYGSVVMGVNFGEQAIDQDRFTNRRTEMWTLMRDWFDDPPVQVPDDDDFQADVCCPLFKQYDSLQRPVFFTKKELQKAKIPSPDHGDSLALTFAAPVRKKRSRKRASDRYARNKYRPGVGRTWMGA